MSRNKRNRRGYQERLARPLSPLDHTASRFHGDLFSDDSVSLADIREAFSIPTVRPLIRTVLVEREPFSSPPRKRTASPQVPVRATFRSSDRQTRSPFLNATTLSPQLTERAILCAKRGIRREVIFATKSTGAGAKAPRRNRSKTRC
jgi:hypothetical protein